MKRGTRVRELGRPQRSAGRASANWVGRNEARDARPRVGLAAMKRGTCVRELGWPQ